jgi:hypothetical protein
MRLKQVMFWRAPWKHAMLCSLGGPLGQNLSLLAPAPRAADPQVFFVHWASTTAVSGRYADIDAMHRVIAVMCVGDRWRPIDYSSHFIIHPDVGISMKRSRGTKCTDRPISPAPIKRLREKSDTALAARIHRDADPVVNKLARARCAPARAQQTQWRIVPARVQCVFTLGIPSAQ